MERTTREQVAASSSVVFLSSPQRRGLKPTTFSSAESLAEPSVLGAHLGRLPSRLHERHLALLALHDDASSLQHHHLALLVHHGSRRLLLVLAAHHLLRAGAAVGLAGLTLGHGLQLDAVLLGLLLLLQELLSVLLRLPVGLLQLPLEELLGSRRPCRGPTAASTGEERSLTVSPPSLWLLVTSSFLFLEGGGCGSSLTTSSVTVLAGTASTATEGPLERAPAPRRSHRLSGLHTLLSVLHGDKEGLCHPAGGLQVAVLVRHYGDDPLAAFVHHGRVLDVGVQRAGGHGFLAVPWKTRAEFQPREARRRLPGTRGGFLPALALLSSSVRLTTPPWMAGIPWMMN